MMNIWNGRVWWINGQKKPKFWIFNPNPASAVSHLCPEREPEAITQDISEKQNHSRPTSQGQISVPLFPCGLAKGERSETRRLLGLSVLLRSHLLARVPPPMPRWPHLFLFYNKVLSVPLDPPPTSGQEQMWEMRHEWGQPKPKVTEQKHWGREAEVFCALTFRRELFRELCSFQ